MSGLKELRNRIGSVKSTQKITSAMKMVAASKLRRAQEQAEASRPYAERMEQVLNRLASGITAGTKGPRLLSGTGKDDIHLLLVMTSDRGLCGGFNATITRETRRRISALQAEGKEIKIITVGRKGRDNLRRDFPSLIVDSMTEIGRRQLSFADADRVTRRVLDGFEAGEFDVCTLIYNQFKSAISQIVTAQQLIPLGIENNDDETDAAPATEGAKATYEFEPGEEEILTDLLPANLSTQVYKALLESAASEQGARMTAMDNATRNAGEMIKGLTLVYNRTRQATITKELIEIISGAEAV